MQNIYELQKTYNPITLGAQLKLSQTVQSLTESILLKEPYNIKRIKTLAKQVNELKHYLVNELLPLISQMKKIHQKANDSATRSLILIINNLIEENKNLRRQNLKLGQNKNNEKSLQKQNHEQHQYKNYTQNKLNEINQNGFSQKSSQKKNENEANLYGTQQLQSFSTSLNQSLESDLETIKQLTEEDQERQSFMNDTKFIQEISQVHIFRNTRSVCEFQIHNYGQQKSSQFQKSQQGLWQSEKIQRNEQKYKGNMLNEKNDDQKSIKNALMILKAFSNQPEQIIKNHYKADIASKERNKQNLCESLKKSQNKTKRIKRSIITQQDDQKSSQIFNQILQNNSFQCSQTKYSNVICFNYKSLIKHLFKQNLDDNEKLVKSKKQFKFPHNSKKQCYKKVSSRMNIKNDILNIVDKCYELIYEGNMIFYDDDFLNKGRPEGYGVLKIKYLRNQNQKEQKFEQIIYNGMWKAGRLDGKGKLNIPSIFINQNNFQRGKLMIKQYNGEFIDNQISYSGIMKFFNEDKLIISNQKCQNRRQCTYFINNQSKTVLDGYWTGEEVKREKQINDHQYLQLIWLHLNVKESYKENSEELEKYTNATVLRQINLNEVNLRDKLNKKIKNK